MATMLLLAMVRLVSMVTIIVTMLPTLSPDLTTYLPLLSMSPCWKYAANLQWP